MKNFNTTVLSVMILALAASTTTTNAAEPEFQTAVDVLKTVISGVKPTDPTDPTPLLDTDNDGIPNIIDNCITVVNADQRDSNSDGYGNMCDADLDDSLMVNEVDLDILTKAFFSGEPDADFNGDGVVNIIDLGILHVLYGQPPGPSGKTD